MDLAAVRHILVYRIGQIGDTIIALPAMWAVRRRFPDVPMALLSDAHEDGRLASARSVVPSGLFDEWLDYPANASGSGLSAALRILPALRRRRFDTLVYLAPRLRQPRQVARDILFFRLAGVHRVLGNRGLEPLPRLTPTGVLPMVEHETDHLLRRLELSGIPAPPPVPGNPALCLSVEEQGAADAWLAAQDTQTARLVGFGPGSKWPSKRWPEERFIALGLHLMKESNIYPIVFGGPEDAAQAGRMIDAWKTGASAAGVLSVREAAAALGRCALYVGNDTGTMHLAAAAGTPCVAVFSAQDWPGRWFPYGQGHRVLRRQVECEGCGLQVCGEHNLRCLREIQVEEVTLACAELLRSTE